MSDTSEQQTMTRRVAYLERQNEQLRRQLEQVEKERVQYLQNVSHQLVAPLNAIKWHIENLTANRVGVERALKVLRSIYSQATLAVHLAKNFNLMSNLEGDHDLSKLKEPMQAVDLLRLLVNLADDFQPLCWDQDKNILVDKRNFDERPPVYAIKPLISQVFSNIVENAVKYSHPGSEIVIRGQHRAGDDSFVVTIRNRGIPLPGDQMSRVFDRGFRSDEAIRKYPAGTGFGLYIARRIVEIHEGEITAYTEDGWSVFSVRLSVSGIKAKGRVIER